MSRDSAGASEVDRLAAHLISDGLATESATASTIGVDTEVDDLGDGATSPDELRSKLRGGLGWSVVNNVLSRLGTFLSGVAMARLLAPADFGTFAAALAVMQIFLGLNDIGLSASLIRWRGDLSRAAGTVMSIVLLTSVGFYALFAALTPFFAETLRVPTATRLLLVLGLTLVSDGLFAAHSAVLTREFLQGRRTAVDMANMIVTTGVSITCAVVGLGPWSLVWGRLAGNAVGGVLIVRLTPIRIRPRWDRDLVGPLLRFGIPLAGSGLLLLAMLNVDYLIIGRLLGPVQLGYYLMAFNLASWPITMFAFAVARLSLAGFSELAHDRTRLFRGYATSLRLLLTVALPACVGLAVMAGPIVRLVYGHKWEAAGPVLTLLGVMSAARVVIEFSYDLLIAIGRPKLVLVLQGVWTCALIPALIIGVKIDGIRGAAWAHVVVSLIVVLPLLAVLLSRAGAPLGAIVERTARPMLAAAAMTLPVIACLLLPTDVMRLGAGIVVGAACYLAIVRPVLGEARSLAR